jgi:hypothetical protein
MLSTCNPDVNAFLATSPTPGKCVTRAPSFEINTAVERRREEKEAAAEWGVGTREWW